MSTDFTIIPESNGEHPTPYVRAEVSTTVGAAISVRRTAEGEPLAGNVLRRLCDVGGAACQAVCQLRHEDTAKYMENSGRRCADANLRGVLQEIGVSPEKLLMVAVTGDRVGFADQLPDYASEGIVTQHPEGWQEIPGFNAFFARTDEQGAIGRRLADCADINFSFTDAEGRQVIGFEHGTRPNLHGDKSYKFERDGKKVSYTEYVLGQAIDHYGTDPREIIIRITAAVQGHNFVKHFDSPEAMEKHVPGWLAAGWLRNATNPDWQLGDAVVPTDEWHADFRGIVLHDVHEAMERLGIPPQNVVMENPVDPVDSDGQHSSYEMRNQWGDSRDLYITYATS